MSVHSKVLEAYWGYAHFRPLQEDIILSVLKGQDTLALLPTGGGKSICYQVPALTMDGICIVISPLIALMKDQVENLRKRNIKAVALISGMSYREIDIALDNCIYGDFKFLYVSPERLASELFIERLKKMKVNLLAVDEHGFDQQDRRLLLTMIEKFDGGPVGIDSLAAAISEERHTIEDVLEPST